MRRPLLPISIAALVFCLTCSVKGEVILQYFETRWDEIYQRLPEIAEVGYESMWTPPPGKSPIGGPYPFAYGGNVGYNSFDRFDLGDMPQRGNWETRYGSRTSLRNLADNAHQMDMKIYPDIVFNHTGNGPDYRTYPGLVPQDFHVWADASQPGGFKRAPRMYLWDPGTGNGGTLHQELVSLMDLELEFDNRFQVGGWASQGYAADPTPYVRHAGDPDKYPYYNQTGYVSENSRQYNVRWINWLGYAMDYDGVRLDAPKHVVKEFFGLTKDGNYTNSFIYNIQKNFNERRGFSDTDQYDDMYSNDIRRDDAMVFSEFFVGSIGEVDYWRNPSDRGWGIQTRYLNFPLKSGMMKDAFNNGNLGTLASLGVSFDPGEAVNFVQSHDEAPLTKLELSYAYLLTHVGVPVVYFTGNNLKDSEIGRAYGKNTWMNKGYDGALGDFGMGAIPNLIYVHNQFARGKEYTRWGENDFFAFERYNDTNNNGSPDSGEGLLLTVLNDSGSDQTRTGIQTSFAPGTALKDYTGKNPSTVYVDSTGKVNITVGGWWGQGYGCWAPYNAEGPASGSAITFSGDGVGTMPWVIPGGRDAAAKPRTVTKLTGNSATIDIYYRNPSQGGETVNNVLVKWGQGRNLNASAADFSGKDPVISGYEQATWVADGHYKLDVDLTNVPEGLHTVKARVFNGRTNNKPALFQTFTTTVYVDRRGPDLQFVNLNDGETVEGARVVTINNPDRTLYNLTYKIDGGADQQADMVIKGQWRISLDGLSSGPHSITLNASEADYGANRAVINSSTLSRNFTVNTDGPSIAINHASGATIGEPFFKTVVTVPTGQSITASDIKLYWDGYEQLPLTENPVGSGKFESTFTGRYVQGGVQKLFTGAFVNGPHFFEAVVTKNGQENRVARRVVFNLYGKNMHDSDGDGIPDDIELKDFLNGTNPGPDQNWPGDTSQDLIPNYGESWSRLNPMNAETYYNGKWDGDLDSDGDGVTNLQEVIKGYRISGNPYAYDIYNKSSVPPATVGSYATSTLSMSNGTKYVTITYRPNDGPLSGASSVTINLTPSGAGSASSGTMTATADGFTYTYTVPAGATSVSYTFSNGMTTDSTGGSGWAASTSAAFVMDGQFDSQNFVVADNGMRIYAAIRGNKLYAATWSPKGGSNDHVIYITDQFGDPVGTGAASGTDSASNYSSWANNSNQGTGFGAWTITAGGSLSGAFLGDPSAAGISGMSSKSFGLYAKGGSGSSIQAYRPLTTALAVGDSISFQWGINWDSGTGEKGFNIWAGSTFLLNVKNQGNNDPKIYVAGTDSGIGYGTQVMTWSITRTADNTLSVRAVGRDGTTFSRDVSVTAAAPSKIEFYAQNLTDGDQRQPYINDLKIYRNGATAKNGRVYGNFSGVSGSKPWIFATPTVANQYGFGASGRNYMGNGGQALECEVDLAEVFGSVPKTVFIAVGAYGGGGMGALLSQAPASFGNSSSDIEITEFQPLNTDSIRDEDLDGKFDVGTPEMIVSVNGNETDGNYGLRRFYLDEVAGDASAITVKFRPNTSGSVSDVEVFTNLNRRDNAVLEEDPATVTTSSNTYFRAYAMSGPDTSGYYTATVPVNLCGAYRVQVRYKVAGVNNNNYIYYTDHAQRRDCAVVVSPKKALTLNMYEVNPLIVEARDSSEYGRSTFIDLVNTGGFADQFGNSWPDALNQGHYAAQGINMLWLQPIHPIGVEGRDTDPNTGQPFVPGSPYAVKDYWSVNPALGRAMTAEGAMSEFKTFVSKLDEWGVGVMMDGTFNHSSPDCVMGQGAVDLSITNASATQLIRDFNPGWYAKEGYPAQPATSTNNIAIAPDRNDFGNWTDVREFYFGDYDALVKEKGTQNADKSYPDNAYKLSFLLERDEFAGFTNNAIRQVWNYFSYYPIYWLDQTGNTAGAPKSQSYKGIDGLRCDFAQGLPSQFWEYTINKTRSRKWDFVFMAESLDGYREVAGSKRHGVGYRSARHFDVLNENVVFYWRDTFFGYPKNGGVGAVVNPATYDTWKAFDDRRNAFDNVVLLNNLVSHDEVFPHNDVWSIAYAYAQVGSLDGIPMIFYGQEAGAQNSAAGYSNSVTNFGAIDAANNFGKYEQNFGKNIPNFKVWNNMASVWNSRTADEWKLQAFYGRVNKARINAPALQSQNVYFLNQKVSGGGYANNMFAVGKVKNIGATAGSAGQSVVFAFANNNYRTTNSVAATFDMNASVPGGNANYFGIERGHKYNVRDLLALDPTAYVWSTTKTGAELIDNGLYIGLPNTNAATGSFQAQYLQLVDVTAPSITFVPRLATYQDVVTLAASNTANAAVTYSLVSGDTNKVTLSGDKLTINSGTGSVTVRATVAGTADYAEATADATITFQKKAQTISGFILNPTTADVSQGTYALPGTASSGLALTYTSSDPTVASASGNTLTLKKAGNITITASQPGDDNYSSVESAGQSFTVTGQAVSFESEFPGQSATSDIDHDGVPALVEYGLGGSSSANDRARLPQVTREGSVLKITVVVRTNDPALTVTGESSTDLASSWTTGIKGTKADDQSSVATGFERRVYSVDIGSNTKSYLRLRFTKN